MSFTDILSIVVSAFILVYLIARIWAAVWFSAKERHLRRLVEREKRRL